MAEPSQSQVLSTHDQGSTQLCRLLVLPEELRLLIYQAYFGPTQKCHVAWTNRICWWVYDTAAGKHTAIGTQLLLVSRQIHEEAQAVMFDLTEVIVDFGTWRRFGPSYPLMDVNAVRFLQHVRVVDIEVEIHTTDCVVHPSMEVLHAVFEAMDYGAGVKKLTFDLRSCTKPWTREPIVPNDAKFKVAISSLRCADGVVKISTVRPVYETPSLPLGPDGRHMMFIARDSGPTQ
ncbi:hypothetical protein LTR17_011867 [Elasticomyces elasticus]|nr:hypothetical protein LTR17_011867 [Elasticomyces elasticus]